MAALFIHISLLHAANKLDIAKIGTSMIAQKYRFHGLNALSYVYKQGRVARSRSCILKYAPNQRQPNCRVAVVVGKKIHKSAVMRNRIRRRITAVLEQRVGDLPAYDMVFTVTSPELLVADKKYINKTIMQLLQISAILPKTVDNSIGD